MASGAFDYAAFDDSGSLIQSGTARLGDSPFAGDCELVLANDIVLLDCVAVSAAQRTRLAHGLRYLADGSTIPEPEAVHVAMAPGPKADSACLAIVDRQWLAQLIARLGRSGLAPHCAYPETLLAPLPAGAWVVVWNAGESFLRTGEFQGLALDEPQGDEPPVALRLALGEAREKGEKPAQVVVRPAEGLAPPDVARWAEALAIEVQIGPVWRWTQFAPKPRLNLLQGEFAAAGSAHGWRGSLRRVATLFAALVLVASAGLAADWIVKAREQKALLGQMQGIFRETFGDQAVMVDPPRQMARALNDLKLRSGQTATSDFLPLLAAAAEAAPGLERQQIESLSYETGKLTLSLRSAPATAVGTTKSVPGIQINSETSGSRSLLTFSASSDR
jgi:general secretion pathway protein L